MRRLLLILLFLLLLSTVSAEKLYSDYVYPGDSFTAGGMQVNVTEGSSTYVLHLLVDGRDLLVSHGDCTRTLTGFEEFCYDQSDYVDCQQGTYTCPENEDTEEGLWCCPHDVKHIKFDSGNAYWGARLNVTRLGTADITMSRAVGETTLGLTGRTEVNLTFKNEGEEALTGGLFRERLPSGFTYDPEESDSLFTWREGELRLKVNLGAGDEQSYTYTLYPTRRANGTFAGNFTYEVRGETRRLFANPFTLTVPELYTLSYEIENRTLLPGEVLNYTLVIRNPGSEPVDIVARWYGLDELKKIPYRGELEQSGSSVEWRGNLSSDEEKRFDFELGQSLAGWYPLKTDVVLETTDGRFLESYQAQVVVREPKLTAVLIVQPETVDLGDSYTVTASLDNGGTTTDYEVLGTSLTLPNESVQRSGLAIPGGETLQVFRETRTARTPGNHTIRFQADYEAAGKSSKAALVERHLIVTAPNSTNASEEVEETDVTEATENATKENATNASVNETNETAEHDEPLVEAPDEEAAEESDGGLVGWLNAVARWVKGWFT